MADNKANALKEANNKYQLIVGSSPEVDGGVIDITDAVKKYYGEHTPEGPLVDQIIGVEEYGDVSMLRGNFVFAMVEQKIRPVIEASIVNAAQKDAVLRIIHQILMQYANECQNGAEYVAHVLN